jgi:hypothetical protein
MNVLLERVLRNRSLLTGVPLLLIVLQGCGLQGAGIIDRLAWSKYTAVEQKESGLVFSFTSEKESETRILTNEELQSYRGTVRIVNVSDIVKPVYIYLAFLNDGNYYRINIYPESGKILFYRKEAGRLNTLYNGTPVPYRMGTDGTPLLIDLTKNELVLECSGKQFFTGSLQWSGKAGFSANGVKGDKVELLLEK